MSPKASDTTEKKPRKTTASRTRKPAATKESVADEAVVAGEAEKAAPVKRAAPRRAKAVAAPEAEMEIPAPKKPRASPRAKKAVAEAPVTEEIVEKKPRRTSRAKPVAETQAEAKAPAPTRRTRAGRTPVKPPVETEAAEEKAPEIVAEAKAETAPVRKPARRRPAATGTRKPAEEAPLHVDGALGGAVEIEPVAVQKPSAGQNDAETAPSGEEERKLVFADLGLSVPLQEAVAEMGYVHPTPIQAQAIPAILRGQDVLGVAQTGTGKTASFTLPMLEILAGSRARARMPRSLILEPTRELALQVAENFVNYGKHLKLTHALLIGGESMADQKEVLNKGVDVLIATPGRLLDLFERGGLLLTQTRILVIDEADRMLDMGFIPDIERIVGLLPPNRQTLFFSATMAPEIRRLADAFLAMPKEITVSRPSTVATTIEAGLVIVEEDEKRKTLRKMLRAEDVQNAIIFCNRKRDVDVLLKSLLKHGFSAGALHGDLPQSVRFQTLEKFRSGELKLLVCSDVAARGIDIGGEGLSHVFNFDLPFHAEDYVHRIGRTGRAGRKGHAYSLATPYDRKFAEAIETLTGKPIPRLEIEGVKQLDWASEEESRENRGRKRKRTGRTDRRDRDDEPQAQSAAGQSSGAHASSGQPARQAQSQPRQQQDERPRRSQAEAERAPAAERDERRNGGRERRRDERRPHGSEIADAPSESVLGFGAEMPAFMKLPRRVPVHTEAMAEDATEA